MTNLIKVNFDKNTTLTDLLTQVKEMHDGDNVKIDNFLFVAITEDKEWLDAIAGGSNLEAMGILELFKHKLVEDLDND